MTLDAYWFGDKFVEQGDRLVANKMPIKDFEDANENQRT